MWNIFEQPWTLTGAAVLTLLVVLTVRSVSPEKHRLKHFLLPLAVLGMAFGLDYFVQTDSERVHATLGTVTTAVENEDYDALERSLAPDYGDSFHLDKAAVLAQARKYMGQSHIDKTKRLALAVRLDGDNATALLTAVIRFTSDSYVAQSYKPAVLVKMRLYLRRQGDGRWLINSSELLEIDRQPTSWRQI